MSKNPGCESGWDFSFSRELLSLELQKLLCCGKTRCLFLQYCDLGWVAKLKICFAVIDSYFPIDIALGVILNTRIEFNGTSFGNFCFLKRKRKCEPQMVGYLLL